MTEATRPAAPEQSATERAATRRAGRERRQGAGLDLFLPYLLLAPSVLTVFGVLVYPLWNGLQTSTKFYRYGRAVSDIGLDNYRRLWSDPEFLDALWITLRFVTISVAIETVLGFALALFCAREFAGDPALENGPDRADGDHARRRRDRVPAHLCQRRPAC